MTTKKSFQTIKTYVDSISNDILYAEGRFVEGDVIRIGDAFQNIRVGDASSGIDLKVINIEMYGRNIDFVDLGMGCRLTLKGSFPEKLKNMEMTDELPVIY